jgi:nitroimidazol reductase NimA-like FMN-containing flavoprotein (pyridoxamine 5'-phosphate oxidase superfamily)
MDMPARGSRNEVKRIKERGHYDRATLHAVLDAGFLAHVGFVAEGQPFVMPMLYWREGDALLLHGSIASRLMNALGGGIAACATITHVDGLVLARSHFHHSVNYRSAVCFGTAHAVEDPAEKTAALARFVEGILPGRAMESRAPDRNELAATRVLRMHIDDFSVKIREGGAKDDPEDRARREWSGVVPLRLEPGQPIGADDAHGLELPTSVQRLLALRRKDTMP